ncbi:MAG: hypothetical protein OEO79_10700 [Gemmatimonadota bacterium]|nr:hypothetical protein [Gemmatimonadota bacterium]MDH3422975.1 hypothetical protein [Gemmatimonadota bacterium]
MSETPKPRDVVATAVQNLVVSRLGRGFIPLVVMFIVGVVQGFTDSGSGGLILSVGSVASAAAMLAYGLRISERTFARPHRAWMSWAMWGSLVPPLFAVYVLGWRGLRVLASGGGAADVGVGIGFAVMGTWAMRSWTKVVEVERLARVMTMDLEGRA